MKSVVSIPYIENINWLMERQLKKPWIGNEVAKLENVSQNFQLLVVKHNGTHQPSNFCTENSIGCVI